MQTGTKETLKAMSVSGLSQSVRDKLATGDVPMASKVLVLLAI